VCKNKRLGINRIKIYFNQVGETESEFLFRLVKYFLHPLFLHSYATINIMYIVNIKIHFLFK